MSNIPFSFIIAYNDDKQIATNVKCTPGKYFFQKGEEHEEKKACQFRRSLLKNCSGIEDPNFGFSHGKPCILIKINRVKLSKVDTIKLCLLMDRMVRKFPTNDLFPLHLELRFCSKTTKCEHIIFIIAML